LIIIPIGDPRLDRAALQRPGDQPLMERMLVVIAVFADGQKALDEVGAGRCDWC
jgi:hypothetical protein